MFLKRIFTVVLLLVISVQVLPVRHVVKYFCNNNITTEEAFPVNKTDSKNCKCFDDETLFSLHHQPFLFTSLHKKITYLNFETRLPHSGFYEVQTPPPNKV